MAGRSTPGPIPQQELRVTIRYVESSRLPTPWAVFDMHGFEDDETD
jgi:hypothetical protein